MRMIRLSCVSLLLLLAAGGLVGCGNVDADTDVVETTSEVTSENDRVLVAGVAVEFNWSEVSGRHTQGMISSNSPVRVAFNRAVITVDKVGLNAYKVMSLSAKVAGSATFVS